MRPVSCWPRTSWPISFLCNSSWELQNLSPFLLYCRSVHFSLGAVVNAGLTDWSTHGSHPDRIKAHGTQPLNELCFSPSQRISKEKSCSLAVLKWICMRFRAIGHVQYHLRTFLHWLLWLAVMQGGGSAVTAARFQALRWVGRWGKRKAVGARGRGGRRCWVVEGKIVVQ